ncbi:MAG: hypothetical protein LBC17_04255 [Lactobacillaceae bacterium]|jgi:ribonuclease J|nr:hypothetical protein [Lactobacillaceae bacterium]
MTEIKFLNGLNTIGGNIVSFANDDTRILMDFGVPVDPKNTDIENMIENGILIDAPEFFTNQKSKYENEAIFISHLHIDHIGALKYLSKNVPIYMSEDSKKLYDQLIKFGDEQEVLNVNAISYEDPYIFGNFQITFFQSDHDVIGASAIQIIDMKNHNEFVYSGDVRYNGPFKNRVDNWISKVTKNKQPELLLIEGTSFSFDDSEKHENEIKKEYINNVEQNLIDKFEHYLNEERPIIINPYPRNVERLFSLEQSAEKNGRPVAWEAFYADLLDQFFPNEHRIRYSSDLNPKEYVFQISFQNIDLLKDLPNSLYLHMNGEPLGSYDPRFEILESKLVQYGAEFVYSGASGHAEKNDLVKISKAINAKITIPWHSFKPELEAKVLQENGLKTYLPNKNEILKYN